MTRIKSASVALMAALCAASFTAPAFADRGGGHGGHGHGGHSGHGHWGHGHGWGGWGGPSIGFGVYTGPEYSYYDEDDDDCYRVFRRGAWRTYCD